jgi:hypothetical protein
MDANMAGFDFTEIEFDFIKKYFSDDPEQHPGIYFIYFSFCKIYIISMNRVYKLQIME